MGIDFTKYPVTAPEISKTLAKSANGGLALAFFLVAAVVVYAVAYMDPYVVLIMAPFFALGCARGKSPLTLLALAAIPVLALLGVSAGKFFYTGMPLLTYDQHFLRQNILMLTYNDWRVALAIAMTACAILLYAWLLFSGSGRFSRFEKAALAAFALACAACIGALQRWDQGFPNWDRELDTPTVRSFIASVRMPAPELHVVAKAEAAAPVLPAAGLTAPMEKPDVFFVLQESTFHPAVVRPGYEPHTLFAKPPFAAEGYAGPLHVHTFAGATWKTEFAVTTQMRPQEFGSDGHYVFYQLEGRIKQSVFTRLKALGYRTMVFYPVAGNFINARNFYASIGVDEFHDPESLGISNGWDWRIPDARFYDAMLKKTAESAVPVAAMMLTINQHGPHQGPDDYVARFAESDEAYAAFLAALGQRGRKAGIVAFGDHQPDFMANLHDRALWYSTAYDIRCINFACAGFLPARGEKPLDAVMLAPAALREFNFGLDDFSILSGDLFKDCDDDVSRCSDAARLGVNSAFAELFD